MRLRKRSISLILVLLMVLALIPAAGAQTGTLAKNSGTRHEVCTSLSSQAEAYYTGIYTYDVVSELPGSDTDPMNSELFNRLHTLMRTTMTNTVTYDSLTDYWPDTDANNGSAQPVLFYSDVVSSSFNREHVWPKSRGSFYQSNAGSDLHHLRPTNANINSLRSHYTMGYVKDVYDSAKVAAYGGRSVLWYTGAYDRVEVMNSIKGDVARILLYVWCRWKERNLYEDDPNPVIIGNDENTGIRVIESLDTLLAWMECDPVDTWEMSRNDQCENVQGNRNVFIDYPEYAWLIFGLTPPADYVTPSGNASGASEFTVTAVSSNPAWGSVSVSGHTVIAAPNEGYFAEDAAISPEGAGTLVRSNNKFRVTNQTADCTVTVSFAPKTTVSVSFDANGGSGTMQTQQVYAGDPFTLPECGFGAPDGQRFAGWKRSSDDTVYQPNASVTISGDCTFAAQWQELTDDAVYTLVETAPADWSGDYLIVYNNAYAMDGSLKKIDAVNNYTVISQKLENKTITLGKDEDNFYFTVEKNGSAYSMKSAGGYYIGWDSNSENGLSSGETTPFSVTLGLSGTTANIRGSAGAYLRFNASSGQDRFRFYRSGTYSNQKPVSLYKREVVIPEQKPSFRTQSLLLSGQIGLNFYMELPEGAGAEYEDSYMTFEISGEGTITERDDFDRGCMNSTGKYYGFTCYVSSIQMADTITATYHYRKDGTEKTVEKTYAVKEYFSAYDEKIAPSASAELTALVHAVADYGHYAQLYLSEQNGWEIGTAYAEMDKYYTTSYDLDSIAAALARYAVVKVNETNGDLDAITCTIVMDSDTTIRILLKPSAGYTEVPAVTIGTESVTPVLQSDGRYRVEIRNLPAQMLSNMYTISVTTANGSATINVSVLSGANSMAGSTKTATKNAGAAIYSYSKAADEYMGN